MMLTTDDAQSHFEAGRLGLDLLHWGPEKLGFAEAITSIDGAHYQLSWHTDAPDQWLRYHRELTRYRVPDFSRQQRLIVIPPSVRTVLVERLQLAADPEELMRLLEAGRLTVAWVGSRSNSGWEVTCRQGRLSKVSVADHERHTTEPDRRAVAELLQSRAFNQLTLTRPGTA